MATGITTILHNDGRQNTYRDVVIRIAGSKQQLTVTSPDGRDTLVVGRAACSYVGDLQRCLLGSITLQKKDGKSRAIAFDQGTVYLNLTRERHQLPLSSRQVPADGVILALHTLAGTFINVTGTIDETVQ